MMQASPELPSNNDDEALYLCVVPGDSKPTLKTAAFLQRSEGFKATSSCHAVFSVI